MELPGDGGTLLEFEPAPEPTDISWENWGGGSRRSRIAYAVVALGFCLSVVFATLGILFVLTSVATRSGGTRAVCERLQFEDFAGFRDAAVEDWLAGRSEVLNCFCSRYARTHGRAKYQSLSILIHPSSTTRSVFNSSYNTNSGMICEHMTWEDLKAYSISYGASAIIVVLNMIVTGVIHFFSDRSPFRTLTGKGRIALIGQFLLSYFLTGLALLVLYVYDIEAFLPFPDRSELHLLNLGREWYNDVGGATVSTLVIRAITAPVVELVIWLAHKARMMWDRGSFAYIQRTKQKTKAAYTALREGPPFSLSHSYSELATYIFVGISFGGIIPATYPAVLLALLISYIQDKLQLAYYHQRPPVFSNSLGKLVLTMLPFAVFVNLALTALAMSQRRLVWDWLLVFRRGDFAVNLPGLALGATFVVLILAVGGMTLGMLICRATRQEEEGLLPCTAALQGKRKIRTMLSEHVAQRDRVLAANYA